MLVSLAQATKSLHTVNLQSFGEVLGGRLPQVVHISNFRVVSEFGGMAQAEFALTREDCGSFQIAVTLGLVGENWVKKKITRQPSG